MAMFGNLFSFACCHEDKSEHETENTINFMVGDEHHAVLTARSHTIDDMVQIYSPSKMRSRGRASSVADTDAGDTSISTPSAKADAEYGDGDRSETRSITPREAHPEIRVCIKKPSPGEPLGMLFDISDPRLLHICSLKLGNCPVSLHNEEAAEEAKLQIGDYIVEVNGLRGNSRAMMRAVKASSEVELAFRKAHEFTVAIDKAGGQLGLDLNHVNNGISLVVEAVLPGPVQVWNDEHPNLAVQRGDRIIAVNSTSGKMEGPPALLKALGAASQLSLVLTRPVGPELPVEKENVLSNVHKPQYGGA